MFTRLIVFVESPLLHYFNPAQIKKFNLTVVDEWEIEVTDVEVMAVARTDDPIIPEGVEKPPSKM